MTLVIDRSHLPETMPLTLSLDEDGSAFPAIDFDNQSDPQPGHTHGEEDMKKDCDHYFNFFGLSQNQLVDRSYSDLVLI